MKKAIIIVAIIIIIIAGCNIEDKDTNTTQKSIQEVQIQAIINKESK